MFILLLLIFPLTVKQVFSNCTVNYHVICDQITDYYDLDNTYWQDLTIGSSDTGGTITKENLIDLYLDMENLKSLTIIGRLEGKYILLDAGGIDGLKHFRLYGNNLDTIWMRSFYSFPNLLELSLQNNNIYYITGRKNLHGNYDIMDLSHNQINDIEPEALLNFRIRKLDLSHNALSSLPPHGLNSSIEILNLDYNQFNFIDENTLNNLVNLTELTLSHNDFATIWDLTPHQSLRKLDFSYNQITRIQTNFNDASSKFPNLTYIDLSFNKLREINFLALVPKNTLERNISLAFNQLTQLTINDWNFTQDHPVTLTLFGNPWICRCLDETYAFFEKNHFRQSKCDLEISGSGKVPYCVVQDYCITKGARPNPKYFESFMRSLEENKKHLTCDVSKEMKKPIRIRQYLYSVGTAVYLVQQGNHTIFVET